MFTKKGWAMALAAVAVVLMKAQTVFGQGCVAVRPMSCSASEQAKIIGILGEGQWQVLGAYRYYKSYKHFRGDVEEHERVENGTQVENITHAIDFGVLYGISNRLGVILNAPIVYYDRSSLYEHYGNSVRTNPDQLRFHTGAVGIGDLRFTANYWLFNPLTSFKGNFSVGLGVKAPTGKANVEDEFHRLTSDGRDSVVVRPVDQSIQLGDGGWGLNFETQGYHTLFRNSSVFFNGFYLFNPKDVNNTLTRGTLAGTDPLLAYHSVADQYAARLGVNYVILPKAGFSASLAGRIEGIPSHDVFGSSEGFRRPGYIVSLEPSISYTHNFSFTLNLPIALYRNRTKSVYDLADPTGQRHGDAAFADYLVNIDMTYKFGKKHGPMEVAPHIDIPVETLQK